MRSDLLARFTFYLPSKLMSGSGETSKLATPKPKVGQMRNYQNYLKYQKSRFVCVCGFLRAFAGFLRDFCGAFWARQNR